MPYLWGLTLKALKSLLLGLLITLHVSPAYALDTAQIIRIVDGDTLKVELKGRRETVRLIGIDTPESRTNNKAYKDAYRSKKDIKTITEAGKRATAYVHSLVKKDDSVKIEYDIVNRDRYNRLLGYVYLSSGEMLNEKILMAGYASIMTYPPNVKYTALFQKAYRTARENRRGLWEEK
jgi:micrococcal nuclease